MSLESPGEPLEHVLARVLVRGDVPAIVSLRHLRPEAWSHPLRARVVAAGYVVEGRLPEARKWADRSARIETAAGTWNVLLAIDHAEQDGESLRRSLAQLAASGDSAVVQALLLLGADRRLRALPPDYHHLLARPRWFPEFPPEPVAPPAPTVQPLHQHLVAPPPPLAPPPPGLTRQLLDDDVVDLVESCGEAIRHQTTTAGPLLAELVEKLLPRVPEAEGRPRKLIAWVNQRVDQHLLVPEAELNRACEALARRGIARWSDGVLVFGPAPTAATATLPPARTVATLTLAGTAVTRTLAEPRPSPGLRQPTIADLHPGDRVGDYTLERKVGQGGMGTVWRATRAGRVYAIKTVRTSRKTDQAALQRELQLLEKVNRADYFPTVFESLPLGEQLFVVMDWVDGETLRDWVAARARLTEVDATVFDLLLTRIADRLHYLHTWQGGGILFRDLKPSNIMIGPNHAVKLVDFGISHLADPTGRALAAGTHGYLAPEVERDQTATPRTDVFSLGRVGLFLLFGHDDFDRIRADQPPPFSIDRRLGQPVVRACFDLAAADPRQRPQDCTDALAHLRRALTADRPSQGIAIGPACNTCARPRPAHARFCPTCGAPTAPVRATTAPPTRPVIEPLTTLAVADRNAFEAYEQLLVARASSDITRLRCLSTINVQPYEYQKDAAVQVMSRLGGKALIADDVGLGKTIEAGLVIKERMARGFTRRVLIVSPPGVLLEQLRTEMAEKFGLEFREFRTSGSGGPETVGPRGLAGADLVIASRGLLSRGNEALLGANWDMLVVDECHHFTNPATKQWTNLRFLSSKVDSVVLLSATPFRGEPEQLWTLFSILHPGRFGDNPREFKSRHVVQERRGGRPRPTREFRDEVRRLTIRRRRGDIGGGIHFPGRDAVRVAVALSADELRLHREVTAAIRGEGTGLVQAQAHRQLASSYESLREGATARRLDPQSRAKLDALGDDRHPKVRALLDRVLPRLPVDEKVLIFSHFQASQRSLVRLLRAQGIGAAGLVGQSPTDRVQAVRRFREDPAVRVLVCGEGAGEGLNLQFCSILVNFDLPWNPMKLEQRIGRVQRLGQRRKRVSVINLVVRDAIEDRVLQILTDRLAMFQLFMGETEQVLGKLLEDGEESGDAFEGWIAALVLENGRVDEAELDRLGQRITRARKEVESETVTSAVEADQWFGSPTAGAIAVPPPKDPPLDLSFLGDG